MKIIDNNSLLDQSQIELLKKSAAEIFKFGGYSSIDDILTSLNVDVIIEPGIPERQVPPFLEEAEKFWREEANRLKEEINIRKDALQEYHKAMGKVEAIGSEKSCYPMRIRGLYDPNDNVIKLFPEEMVTEYKGLCMEELLVSTLAHETMHAYFNRPGHESFPYVYFVEEPLAEFGMLLYLNETNSKFLDWVKKDVSKKETCYHYGADLFAQYENGDFALAQYLEDYKVLLDVYAMLDMITVHPNGTPIIMPGSAPVPPACQINVNGTTISANWSNVYCGSLRYFYDDATKTLGLDGDWSEYWCEDAFWQHRSVPFVFCKMIHDQDVKMVYLGNEFTIKKKDSHMIVHQVFSKVTIIVSSKNEEFTAGNGIPIFKHNNKPAVWLRSDGYYNIRRNGKWGVIDENLKQVIPYEYDIYYIGKIEKDGQ